MATLVEDVRTAGEHSVQWSGLDHHGRAAPSGVYCARLEMAIGVRTRKIILVR